MTRPAPTQIHVMQIIHTLDFGGAERLAATISHSLPRDAFQVSVCGLFGGAGPLTAELLRRSVPHFYLEAEKRSKLSLLYGLYRLLREQRVDIVQVHGAYGLMHSFLPARLAGVKIIYTEHAKQSILRVRRAGLAARYLPSFIARTVCVSDNLRVFFRETLGVRENRLTLVYNGIDVARFRSEHPAFPDKVAQRTIGCIARLTEAKDHGNLLAAFAEVVKLRGPLRLVLVGDGELRGAIEQMVAELGISAYVDLLGSRDDIPELLSRMDIFVLPSKREGFPVAILEAMAAGRPVVATEVGGVCEVITSGENGIIVPAGDSAKLAQALLRLLDDPPAARLMALKGEQLVSASFDVQQMSGQYARLFRAVMAAA
jgi:L-malate glycosyltransferase